ncbi:MAG TPA: hypothetical protein VL084_09435, partial [Thermoanaerobaculia bacterium]|nr:hypothetical protein [Thermoanaerobaculia bacterium]
GNPSGYQPPPPPKNYVFLEANRIDLYQNTQIIPGYTTAGAFNGGWIDMLFRNDTTYVWPDSLFSQAWVGVQHTGPGTLLNVGHGAPLFQTGSYWDGFDYTQDYTCTEFFLITGKSPPTKPVK